MVAATAAPPAPTTSSRHEKSYLTDEMAVFWVCYHLTSIWLPVHRLLLIMMRLSWRSTVVFPPSVKAENRLFRIPQCLFAANSPVFDTMFSLPSGDSKGH